jgi:PhnB protein
MAGKVRAIPKDFHTATPYLTVSDAARAIDFYKKAFGAQERMRMAMPNGKIGHAEIQVGDSIIMLADEMQGGPVKSPQSLGGTTGGVFLYVDNVDDFFKRAVAAGAQVEAQPENMFWGDRYGRLKDPFGHSWSMGTHVEDVAPEEMSKRMQEAAAKMAQQHHSAH